MFFLLLLAATGWGCRTQNPAEDANGVVVSELPGTSYGVAILDNHGLVTLLGKLRFDSVSDDTITGTWLLETWGEQPGFPGLIVNTGEQFPDGPPVSTFSGQVFGDAVILRLPMPQGDRVLGIFIDRQDGTRLFGSVDTLPDQEFSGSIEALREIPAP
jgi:hypothetical protein